MFSDLIQGIGSAAGDAAQAAGQFAAAGDYKQAATIAEQNAQISAESTAIQQQSASRQIYQTIGGQQAQVGAAGFASGGSSLSLLHASAAQGAITHQLLEAQGQININSYNEQASAYKAQAQVATAAGTADAAAGATSAVTGVLKFFGL
jgi:hypothetical protein